MVIMAVGLSLGGHGGLRRGRGVALLLDLLEERLDAHRSELAPLARADVEAAGLGFAFAYDGDIGHLLQAGRADLVADAIGAEVDLAAQPSVQQADVEGARVLGKLVADRNDLDLQRRQPERKGARVALYDDAEKALQATVASAVHHDGRVALAVGAH